MYRLYIDLYIYKTHTAPRKPMLIGISNKEQQIPQQGKCTLERFLFLFLQLISIYMRVPKTQFSAKRCIHPKFIFVREDFFF